jgi:DNA-binding MarR family transcriptional regulator
MVTPAETCAHEVLDVVPLVMRAIRAELRRRRTADLSLAQFRTLAYLNSHAEVSLSEVAEHIGLSLPTMSKLVDGLLGRGLLTRVEDPSDRRRVLLCLTEEGRAMLGGALAATQSYLAGLLGELLPDQQATVVEAMAALRSAFMRDSRQWPAASSGAQGLAIEDASRSIE